MLVPAFAFARCAKNIVRSLLAPSKRLKALTILSILKKASKGNGFVPVFR